MKRKIIITLCVLVSAFTIGCTSAKQVKYYNRDLKLHTTLTSTSYDYAILTVRAQDYDIQCDISTSHITEQDDGTYYLEGATFTIIKEDGEQIIFAYYIDDGSNEVNGDTLISNPMADANNGMMQIRKYAKEVLNDTSEDPDGIIPGSKRSQRGAAAFIEEAKQYLPELMELKQNNADKGLQKEA